MERGTRRKSQKHGDHLRDEIDPPIPGLCKRQRRSSQKQDLKQIHPPISQFPKARDILSPPPEIKDVHGDGEVWLGIDATPDKPELMMMARFGLGSISILTLPLQPPHRSQNLSRHYVGMQIIASLLRILQ